MKIFLFYNLIIYFFVGDPVAISLAARLLDIAPEDVVDRVDKSTLNRLLEARGGNFSEKMNYLVLYAFPIISICYRGIDLQHSHAARRGAAVLVHRPRSAPARFVPLDSRFFRFGRALGSHHVVF